MSGGPFDALRKRLDFIPAEHHTRPLISGLVVIGVVMFALVGAATRHIPLTGKSGHPVRAEFAAADQVSKRTVVRVGGIEVGRVDKVQAGSTPTRTSLVTMRITNSHVKLHQDASAQIRWRTLLGGLMYIDLQPGSPSAPLLGDAPIPASQTSSQVELDQFLQPYTGTTAQAQRDLLKGLRYTFTDPQGVGRTLRTLPVLRTVGRGLKPLRGTESGDLRRLVAATAKTVQALDDTAGLRDLVAGADRTLGVTEARRNELGQLLDLAPPSLDSTFTTMARLRTTLDHLDPLAARLRPGARALAPAAQATTPALRQTRALLREIRPLLRAAGPTFDALGGASRSGVPLMAQLDPTLTRLDGELLPYLRKRDSGTRLLNYEAIGPFWAALAMDAGEFDRAGYRIRFTVPFGPNSFISSPVASAMARACARSAIRGGAAECAKVDAALARSWFGVRGGSGR
jgi:virulence factor Mce-like protein